MTKYTWVLVSLVSLAVALFGFMNVPAVPGLIASNLDQQAARIAQGAAQATPTATLERYAQEPSQASKAIYFPVAIININDAMARKRTPTPTPTRIVPTSTPIVPTPTSPAVTPLPTATGEPNTLTFTGGDWEKGITGTGLWSWIEVASSDRITRVTSPVRQGMYAAKVVLYPGDTANGPRSEVCRPSTSSGTKIYENETTGYEYVGFSVMLPADWQSPTSSTNAWGVVTQLHGPDAYSASPAWSLNLEDDYFYVAMTAGDMDHMTWPFYSLSESGLNKGKWIDFVVKIVYSKTNGSYTLWRRDEGETVFTVVSQKTGIPTLQYKTSTGGSVLDHYWKHGFYRNPDSSVPNTLYLDGFTIGKSFDAVVAAAFRR